MTPLQATCLLVMLASLATELLVVVVVLCLILFQLLRMATGAEPFDALKGVFTRTRPFARSHHG